MSEFIKISLVLSGEDNVEEFHRIIPASDFEGCRIDFFTREIDSLRDEVRRDRPDLKGYEEYIRVAAIDTVTGAIIPTHDG